jgi:hypothetical protein
VVAESAEKALAAGPGLSQPTMTFDGRDLYPDTVSKPVALGFS